MRQLAPFSHNTDLLVSQTDDRQIYPIVTCRG